MDKHYGHLFAAAALAAATMMAGCGKSTEGTMPSTSTAASNVSDSDVTEHVKTALQQNDALKRFDIKVVTAKGDVRLIGIVDTQAQVDEAIKVARAAEGGHTIHDELTIKK